MTYFFVFNLLQRMSTDIPFKQINLRKTTTYSTNKEYSLFNAVQ